MDKISNSIRSSPRAQAILAIVGVCLVSGGIFVYRAHLAGTGTTAPPQPALLTLPAPQNIHAQEDASQGTQSHPVGNQHQTGLPYFSGTWKNADAKTRGLTTLKVRTAGESVFVRAWGACHPTDCDWGEVPGNAFAHGVSSDLSPSSQKVTALFETSFSNTLLTLSPTDEDELQADTQTHFTDNSGRTSYSTSYTFRHQPAE